MLPEITFMPLEFLRPLWLLGLIALLLFALLKHKQNKNSGDQALIAPHLSANIVTNPSQSKPRWFAFYSALAIACIALSGPTIRSIDMPVYEMEKAQVIVFDLSYSMYATDIKPNRLSQAQFKAIDLIKQWSEGEKAMIAYAGDAFTVAPLTRDGNAIINHIPHLSPDIMPVRGSRADLALAKAIDLLKNAGYSQGHIVFISDDIKEDQAKEMIKMLKGENWIVSILAVATTQGAPITLSDGSLLKSPSGEIVVPKLSAQPFYDIAKASKGLYLNSSNNSQDINQLGQYFEYIEKNEKDKNLSSSGTSDQFSIDDGYWLSFLLLPLCLLLFRKGFIFALIFAVYLPFTSAPVKAASETIEDNKINNSIWKNNQQNAFQAYQDGQYQIASELYENPLEKGSALYKNKQFEQALEEFTKATQLQPNNADTFYNQANSFAQLQQFDKAIEAYDKAISIRPDMAQATENKKIIEEIKKQQQNQEQNQEQSQEQNSQQQNQEENSQQQNQEQNSQQQSQEQQQQNSEQTSEKDQQKAEQQKKQQEQEEQQKQQAEQQEDPEKSKDEQQSQQAMMDQTDEENTQELEELPNWLKNMPDDPSILLRRKMQQEYQKRAQSQPVKQQQNTGVIW